MKLSEILHEDGNKAKMQKMMDQALKKAIKFKEQGVSKVKLHATGPTYKGGFTFNPMTAIEDNKFVSSMNRHLEAAFKETESFTLEPVDS